MTHVEYKGKIYNTESINWYKSKIRKSEIITFVVLFQ